MLLRPLCSELARRRAICGASIALLAAALPARAQSGTWQSLASGGLWSDPLRWSAGIVASGVGSTADLSALNLAVDNVVHLDSARTLDNLIFGDTVSASPGAWILDNNGSAANILPLSGISPTVNVSNLGAGKSALISAELTGGAGLTKTGSGTLVLTAANSFTGALAVRGGTLALDFSAPNAPLANIVAPAVSLTLGGGTLSIIGSVAAASSQGFAGTAVSSGLSVLKAAPASGGVSLPTVSLGSLAVSYGASLRFEGAATIDAAGSVAATAKYLTNTAGAGALGLLGNSITNNSVGGYATVGLYDWASTSLPDGTAGTAPYTILGGSQVAGFYVSAFPNAAGNFDMTASQALATGTRTASSVRFNTPGATTLTLNSTTGSTACLLLTGGFLVTPNMGASNVSVVATASTNLATWQIARSTSNGNQQGVIWQNNTLGYMNFTAPITDGRQGFQVPRSWSRRAPARWCLIPSAPAAIRTPDKPTSMKG